jgi:hypothetical protein
MKKAQIILILLLSCAGFFNTLATDDKPIECYQIDSPIKIDGEIKEKAWLSATKLTGFHILGKKKIAACQSIAAIAYDQQYFYLAILMQKKFNEPLYFKSLWHGDAVELFLVPNGNLKKYFQVAANKDEHYSGINEKGKDTVSVWNKKILTASKEFPCAWTMEMAIPFSWLETTPSETKDWKFNICRDDPKNGLTTYSVLLKGSFHSISEFKNLSFKKGTPPVSSDSKAALKNKDLTEKIRVELQRQIAVINRLSTQNPGKNSFEQNNKLFSELLNGDNASLKGMYAEYWRAWLLKGIQTQVKNQAWLLKTVTLFE